MSDHKRALVPLASWSYSAPELCAQGKSIDIGLFAEALIYYDNVAANITTQPQFAEFLQWFISQGRLHDLIALIREDTVAIYDYAFATTAVNHDGIYTLCNIQDQIQAQPDTFEERFLGHSSVKAVLPNESDHEALAQALRGKVIEVKAEEFGAGIENARIDLQDPRRNALIIQSFVDELYRQNKLGRPPEIQAVVTASPDGTKHNITVNVDFTDLHRIAGANLNFNMATPITAAAHCNRLIWSGAELSCDLYLGTPMSMLVGDKLFESMERLAKTGHVIEDLQARVEFPDVRSLVNAGTLDFLEILAIRKKARKFRQWLQQESERDRDAIIAYHNELGKELGVVGSARKALSLFGILGSGGVGSLVGAAVAGPVGGALGGAAGSGVAYLADVASKFGAGWKPVVFGDWLRQRIEKLLAEGTESNA